MQRAVQQRRSEATERGGSTSEAGARRIAKYYDQTQILYTRIWSSHGVHYGLWDATTRRRREAIRNLDRFVGAELDLPEGSRVLDAGCGIGGTSLFLARQHGFDVLGITLSEYQLGCARRSAGALRARHRPTYALADYLDTGLPEEDFDGVIAIESACYAESKLEFLSEMSRVLRPGGRLVVADGFRGEVGADDRAAYQRMMNGMALTDLATPEEFLADIDRAGFVDARVHDKQSAVLRSAVAIERLSYAGIVVCALPCALGIFPRGWFSHGIAGISQRGLFERGAVLYRIFTARKPDRQAG